jgi:hypothetical protein
MTSRFRAAAGGGAALVSAFGSLNTIIRYVKSSFDRFELE